MTIALTLLVSAMQLLTLVANTPSLSTEFKNNAILIANQAVTVAQDELSKANQVATVPVTIPQVNTQNIQTVQQPTFGGIIVPMDKSEIIAEVLWQGKADPANDLPIGVYAIKVTLKDSNGNYVKDGEITMNGTDTRKMDSISGIGMTDWFHTFTFIPSQKGNTDVTFTSGNLSKTLTINVQ